MTCYDIKTFAERVLGDVVGSTVIVSFLGHPSECIAFEVKSAEWR
jgi:hypothetical protein